MSEEQEFLNHDLVKYDNYHTMMDSINSRYEEGDLRCRREVSQGQYFVIVEKLYKDHKWIRESTYWNWDLFFDVEHTISLRFYSTEKAAAFIAHEQTDYVFPISNTALLSHTRTEKLRRRRVAKPAYMGKKEEEEEDV